jgi:hypothetical protein
MSIARDCLIWKLWVKRGADEVALESVAIKRKEGYAAMGFSKDIGSEGGGTEDEDSGVSTKRVLAVDDSVGHNNQRCYGKKTYGMCTI